MPPLLCPSPSQPHMAYHCLGLLIKHQLSIYSLRPDTCKWEDAHFWKRCGDKSCSKKWCYSRWSLLVLPGSSPLRGGLVGKRDVRGSIRRCPCDRGWCSVDTLFCWSFFYSYLPMAFFVCLVKLSVLPPLAFCYWFDAVKCWDHS